MYLKQNWDFFPVGDCFRAQEDRREQQRKAKQAPSLARAAKPVTQLWHTLSLICLYNADFMLLLYFCFFWTHHCGHWTMALLHWSAGQYSQCYTDSDQKGFSI